MSSFIHCLSLISPLYVLLRDSRHPSPYRATTCRERELTVDHIRIFLTTQGHGGLPRMRAQLNVWSTSATTRSWKTLHTIHAPIKSNKAIMKGWLWRPNDIRGPCGVKLPDICLTWEENSENKHHPGNLSRPEIEPGLAAWQARILPPDP